MAKKIPTYSICNLAGLHRCGTEIVVTRLREFIESMPGIVFPHRHDFYQIVLFTEGGGSHTIDFQRFAAVAHQVYYMAPGQVHSWHFDDRTDGYLINFNDSFFTAALQNPNFVRDFPLFSAIVGQPVSMLELDCCSEVEQAFSQMLAEFRGGGEFKMEVLRGLLTIILAKLSRAAPTPYQQVASKHNVALMRQFEQLIEENFREKRLPKTYAEMLAITPNHLNALANEITGQSAGALIRKRVLLESKRLLANSDMMVSQIADALNFEDNAYFTRFFKKYMDMPPEVFRRAQNGQLQAN